MFLIHCGTFFHQFMLNILDREVLPPIFWFRTDSEFSQTQLPPLCPTTHPNAHKQYITFLVYPNYIFLFWRKTILQYFLLSLVVWGAPCSGANNSHSSYVGWSSLDICFFITDIWWKRSQYSSLWTLRLEGQKSTWECKDAF